MKRIFTLTIISVALLVGAVWSHSHGHSGSHSGGRSTRTRPRIHRSRAAHLLR